MKPRDWTALLYGNVMDVVASTIRGGITAPPGKLLVVCDLSSIESRVLGWMSGCQRINNIFATGKDTYKDFASHWFDVPYEEVTKAQRTLSKPPDLGCGYQLSAGTLVDYARSMGVEMGGKEAKQAVRLWRRLNPEVPKMWEWLVESCKECIRSGLGHAGYGVTISRDDSFLFIRLPSGRNLHYYLPSLEWRKVTVYDPETEEERTFETESITYMGMHQQSHQWSRLSTHGGKLTENIVQAVARDILAHGIKLAEPDPILEIVGHVHDEIICLGDEPVGETGLKRLTDYMSAVPAWAPGLMLGAAGYTAKRYRKE